MPIKVFFCCKKSLRNLHTRYLLFKRGEDKLSKEFDVVEFARSQRKLKMLMHWLMDKSEKFLTAYQKSNAISLSTESDSNSDDPAYTKIPKMLTKGIDIQNHCIIVSKFFKEYLKEQHTGKDVNLLYGVFSNSNTIDQQVVSNLFKETDKKVININPQSMSDESVNFEKSYHYAQEENKGDFMNKREEKHDIHYNNLMVENQKPEMPVENENSRHFMSEINSQNENPSNNIIFKDQPKSNLTTFYNKEDNDLIPKDKFKHSKDVFRF